MIVADVVERALQQLDQLRDLGARRRSPRSDEARPERGTGHALGVAEPVGDGGRVAERGRELGLTGGALRGAQVEQEVEASHLVVGRDRIQGALVVAGRVFVGEIGHRRVTGELRVLADLCPISDRAGGAPMARQVGRSCPVGLLETLCDTRRWMQARRVGPSSSYRVFWNTAWPNENRPSKSLGSQRSAAPTAKSRASRTSSSSSVDTSTSIL